MVSNEELHQKVSQDTLESLLKIHGEGDTWDFKETFSLKSRARAELVRDILAFANTVGGGHIVFGVVDKTYVPAGLSLADDQVDTTTIYKAIKDYILSDLQLMAAEYQIQILGWPEKRRFGILYIPKYYRIAMVFLAEIVAHLATQKGTTVEILFFCYSH